ncbi:MAG: hypothetical protein Q8R32_02770 [bacterium]|nr:hypothetical protein [bacterium]
MTVAPSSPPAASPTLGGHSARRDAGEGFNLPPIRTMADDLADAARGTLASASGVPLVPLGSTAAVPPSTPTGGLVRLPAAVRPRRRGLTVSLFLLFGLVLVGIGAWAALRLIPVSSGTVADAVPAEAQSFVSVRNGDPQTAALLSTLLSSFEGLTADHFRGATDLTYLLLPGPSPAEPVPALLVRGVQTVNLSDTPTLGVQAMTDGVLITDSAHLGRLNALSGSTWGRERPFRNSLRGFPENAPVLLAFRPEALATFLQSFAPHALSAAFPLVMAAVPAGDGSANVVVRSGSGSERAQASVRFAGDAGADSAKSLPQSTLLAMRRPVTVLGELQAPAASERPPSGLRPILQALHERAAAFGAVLQSFEGMLTLGVLPTETAGIRDLVAIVPLKTGTDIEPQLRELESAGPTFGPYLTGSSFADAAFREAEYQGVRVRYMNFGSSTRSFDYAVVDQTLLLATSRASMNALIDTARGATPSLAENAAFGLLSGIADNSPWIFFRGASELQEELPPAYRVLADLLGGLFLRSTGSGLFTGSLVLTEPTPSEPSASAAAPGPEIPSPAP